jgi:Mn2+/Fe2+ NRAMP family transporter
MADMGGAYPVADLLKAAAIGLVILLAVVLLIAGTLVSKEKRKRFMLWCVGIYGVGWIFFLTYNTYLLIRYFFGLKH